MFRVGLTGDFLRSDGRQAFADVDTSVLDEPGVDWRCLPPVDLTCAVCLQDDDCLGGGI